VLRKKGIKRLRKKVDMRGKRKGYDSEGLRKKRDRTPGVERQLGRTQEGLKRKGMGVEK
jgi:hypothetical protein